jgi:aryl-alcohol dehydrogenase-like predicted oxidoreductase
VKSLKPIADGLGITRGQLALAWVLRHPGVSSVITGATKAEQVVENVKAAEVTLSDDVIAAIEKALSGETH